MATGLSSLKNLVECALCLEGYKIPRVLPCQHCFCEQCLKQHISKNSKPGGAFQCPSCRQKVDNPKEGVAGFPISFTLNKLQDALDNVHKQKCISCGNTDTTKKCNECESLLCLQCYPSHYQLTSGTSIDDPIPELGGAYGGLERIILESIFCKIHPKKQMSLYCEDCTEAICNACIVIHKRHAIIEQEEKASHVKKSIKDSVAKMVIKLQLCQDQGYLRKEQERVRVNVDEVISQVKIRCNDICKQVHSAEKEIITQLIKECAEIETRIDTKIEENVALSHKLESCIEKQQGLRETPEAMIIIQGKQKLEPEVEELTKAEISRIEEHVKWRFVPGTMDAKSMKALVGTLQTSYTKCCTGVESFYKHKSNKTAALVRNLSQKPVSIHSLSCKNFIHDFAICEDGKVFVATIRGIEAYSTAGDYTHTIAPNTDVKSIAELSGGKLAISCCSDKAVKVFSKDGSYVHTIAADQGEPWGVALLHNGALAVSYPWEENYVQIFKDCGERAAVVSVIRRFSLGMKRQQPTTSAGMLSVMKRFSSGRSKQPEKEPKRIWYLTAHGENGVIVSDFGAHAVYAFTAGKHGEYTCQWMYGGQRGSGPGMLDSPRGVATDSQGRVLIADCGNHRVLLLSHDGEMLMELLTQENGFYYTSAVAVGAGKLAVTCDSIGISICTYN